MTPTVSSCVICVPPVWHPLVYTRFGLVTHVSFMYVSPICHYCVTILACNPCVTMCHPYCHHVSSVCHPCCHHVSSVCHHVSSMCHPCSSDLHVVGTYIVQSNKEGRQCCEQSDGCQSYRSDLQVYWYVCVCARTCVHVCVCIRVYVACVCVRVC